ncbi:hypothetical protein MM213_18730 [Belliella sp. R4-6]|uniref:Uncharacterized protein n=1 Tax=Belliella alkalica TaxID=1730871 RepID=A0ABS9VGH9_9BACT|nr:hypothetical protein [Belliella alkalica]MCH7415544.1 hypothetical protein [Belliella alkalica]
MKKTLNISILEVAILEMGRMKNGEPFHPLEVIKWIYPQDWSHFFKDLESETNRLINEGKVFVDSSERNLEIGKIRIYTKFKTT